MIHAAELARLLDSLNVRCFFNDADDRFVARGAGAEQAGIGVRDVVADGTFANFLFGIANRVRKRKGGLAISTQQVEGEALRGFLADAWEVLQFFDEAVY